MYCKRLIVSGKVQGVFYRATAKKVADEFGVKGWIKNLGNGDVEAYICGTETQLKNFIEWARRGSHLSSVEKIEIFDEKEEFFGSFQIKK